MQAEVYLSSAFDLLGFQKFRNFTIHQALLNLRELDKFYRDIGAY